MTTKNKGREILQHLAQESGLICNDCNRPSKMYWCKGCEEHSENKDCDTCGRTFLPKDKQYHAECSEFIS